MISQKFWGGKGKSFDTLIFPELQKMKMFVIFYWEGIDGKIRSWEQPADMFIASALQDEDISGIAIDVKIPKYLIVPYQYSNPPAFSSAFKRGKEGCLRVLPF